MVACQFYSSLGDKNRLWGESVKFFHMYETYS